MPTAGKTVCTADRRCPHLVDREHPCPVHGAKKPWHHHQEVPRIRGRKLQKLRAQLFAEQPFCVMCLGQGQKTIATIRDHIIPLFEGGEDTDSNTQPLCQSCSDAKTAAESHRGKRAHMGGGR